MSIEPIELVQYQLEYDIALEIIEGDETFQLIFYSGAKFFSKSDLEGMAQRYIKILNLFVENISKPLEEISNKLRILNTTTVI